jgi:hypothetical protein
MRGGRDIFLLACEVLGIGAALLVLPCALFDAVFDTQILSLLSPGILFAVACAAILTVVTVRD